MDLNDMICPYCGAENPEGTRICVRCYSWLGEVTQQPAPQAPQPSAAQVAKTRSPMLIPIVIIVAVLVVGSIVIAAVVLGNTLIPGVHLEITNAVHSTAVKDASSIYLVFDITVKNKGTEAGSATISCNATYGILDSNGDIATSSKTQAATQHISLASGEEQTFTLKISIGSTYGTPGHYIKYYERLN